MTTTEPQPQESAQSPLALWNEQVQGLAAPEHADAAINSIYENLMGLHAKLTENGNAKAAAKVEDAYNMAVAIYNTTTQQGVVIAGGAAAIEAAEVQRNEAVTELQQLLTAIADDDTSHPKLTEFAEGIRQDEYERTMNDPYLFEGVYDDAMESADQDLYETVQAEWKINFYQADGLLDLLKGNTPATDEQKRLMQALIAMMPTEARMFTYTPPTSVTNVDEDDEDMDGDE